MRIAVLLLLAGACVNAQPRPARDFVTQLARGQFAEATRRFSPEMKAALPPEKLADTWKSIEAQAGAFDEIVSTRAETIGQFQAIFVATRFAKATLDIQVTFNDQGQVAGLFVLPHAEPAVPSAAPDTIIEKPIEVAGLPGTLTLPKGAGPFPALALVHGSGPNDRDETIGNNKPFRDLAWGLAPRGVAVLRYDKRTKVHPEQFGKDGTAKEETIDDAAAAVKLLTGAQGIDPKRVFVLGHSLGGMLIPRIAKVAPEAAGFVILAGNTTPLDRAIVEQMEHLKSPMLEQTKKEMAKIQDLKPGDPPVMGLPASYWIDLRGYKPEQAAREIRKPLLILQGGRDYQVTTRDFEAWKQALAGMPNVTFRLYPELNHLFIAGAAGHVPEEVIGDIANWIKTESRPASGPATPARDGGDRAR